MGSGFLLEMDLNQPDKTGYALRLRFSRPADAAESNLGLAAPVPVEINEDTLRGAAGDPDTYGKSLTTMLFADPSVRQAFASARAAADSAPQLRGPLRLRLSIDPGIPQLHNLRWETLLDPNGGPCLSTDENILFSRLLSGANLPSFEPPTTPRLHALVMIASPQSPRVEPIDVAGYLARAQAGLAEMDITALPSGGQATLDALIDHLEDGCEVLYLVAHGIQTDTDALVILENPDCTPAWVEVDTLLQRLRQVEAAKLPLLAVLVSCESAGDAMVMNPLLALGPRLLGEAGIPAVLGMHGKISFDTMDKFLPVFFKELARDGVIDRALTVARARVTDQPDWWMPVLFSRLPDNQLLQPPPFALPLALQPFEPETVYLPPGPFWMGRDTGSNVPAWEQPRSQVTLPAYRIGAYPVTNDQYREYIRQTGKPVSQETNWGGSQVPPSGMLSAPVTGITWYEAMDYCKWLSAQTNRKYTLPNEAQWERAARGTQGQLYPWGDIWPASMPLPRQAPSGCFEMVGGVREWTISLWGDNPWEAGYPYPWQNDGRNDPNANPLTLRVFRGGPGQGANDMTCTARGGFAPDKPGPPGKRHGFRVALLE